jgi:hypothetical protein
MSESLDEKIFDMVPKSGRYERDILFKLINVYPQRTIEIALERLCNAGHLRKCGDKARPLYVRMVTPKVFYSGIAPAPAASATSMLQMHSNFEERP